MNRRTAFVTDFDGTVVTVDVGDAIVRRFVPEGESQLSELYQRVSAGEIDLPALQRAIWPLVRCEPEELCCYLDRIAIVRGGFSELAAGLAVSGIPFVIASGGFDFYIDHILAGLDLGGASPTVIANRAVPVGGGIVVDFPHRDRLGCATCTVCKGKVLEGLRTDGYRTVFCGDGMTDRCALESADLLFCVEGSTLHRLAAERDVPYTPFSSFNEVARGLRDAGLETQS
ncbi:HAD-IB family phosphatase [Planctomycetota bacterium]